MENSRNHPIDCGLATTPQFSRQFAKQTIANRSANIQYLSQERVVDPQNVTNFQFGDLNVLRYDQCQSVNDYIVNVISTEGNSAFVKTITSSNSAILLQSNNDPFFFSHVSNGSCVINIELVNGEKYAQRLTTRTTTTAQVDVFQSFVNGSLIKHINDSTVALLDGSTQPLLHYAYYAGQPYVSNNFVKNEGCWFKDFDISGTSIFTGGGSTRMCNMVSPSFAVGINHNSFHPQVGETVKFCNQNGEIFSRIVENVSFLVINYTFGFGPLQFNRDFSLIKFTQPVPESIKKYKLFPNNIVDYLPYNINLESGIGIEQYSMAYCPMVCLSHYMWDSEYPQTGGAPRNNRYVYCGKVTSADFVRNLPNATDPPSGNISFRPNADFPNYNGSTSWIQGGDSGGPVFAIVNNDIVLLGSHISGYNCNHLGSFSSAIQDKMDEVGSNGETIQYVDLSEFTDFSS